MNSGSAARDLIYGNIDAIMANAQKLRAREVVSIDILLTDDFMQSNTNLSTAQELFALAGAEEINEQTVELIPDELWNEIIETHTGFSNWDEMFTKASQSYVRSQLLAGVEVPSSLS
ncbi:hypothetical protein [Polycladidibacter stylochi]|uniref:hypothetical protein n=1 Tax=Polycladidibacter stylochi TaxID=1807766 RepID=UPI0008356DC4|nr:hypothetical protein [Pseudovibrio stylochi]